MQSLDFALDRPFIFSVLLRNARQEDGADFARLLLISAPYFPWLWGVKTPLVLSRLFSLRSHLFSFENTVFAEINGRIAGMMLGYDFITKQHQNLRTGLLLFTRLGIFMLKKLPVLLKFNTTVGQIRPKEYYISNLAVYPPYRGQGIGEKLLRNAETTARTHNCRQVTLDVEQENTAALRFYQRLGYQQVTEFSVRLNPQIALKFLRLRHELR